MISCLARSIDWCRSFEIRNNDSGGFPRDILDFREDSFVAIQRAFPPRITNIDMERGNDLPCSSGAIEKALYQVVRRMKSGAPNLPIGRMVEWKTPMSLAPNLRLFRRNVKLFSAQFSPRLDEEQSQGCRGTVSVYYVFLTGKRKSLSRRAPEGSSMPCHSKLLPNFFRGIRFVPRWLSR